VILLLEPFGGLAGDMLLAGLLDLGRDEFQPGHLAELAQALVPGEVLLEHEEVRRGGFRARRLGVRTPESRAAPHRHLSDLLGLLESTPPALLSPRARARAGRVLERLGRAEARVHGIDLEEVHFHEVGAVDTLIDVCGAVLALERLGVEGVRSSPPYVGGGRVTCAHGELPVPAPGTAELLRGLPVRAGPGGERVTPTGAALLAELVDSFELEGEWTVLAQGHGAGSRDPEEGPPNLLRVSLARAAREAPRAAGGGAIESAVVWQLECNLDDTTGEELGFLLGELRGAGALDAWTTPLQMKKDRPGVLLAALARPEQRAELERLVFAHSPTLGLRWIRCERSECRREELEVSLRGARVRVKVRRRGPGAPERLDLSPEHEDLARLARSSGLGLRALEQEALQAALLALGGPGAGPGSGAGA